MKHLLALLILVSSCVTATAQTLSDSARVSFRQSHIELDTLFAGNGLNLNRFLERVDSSRRSSDSIFIITGVRVRGAASPEGSVTFNKYLSDHRAKAIFDYLDRRVQLPDSLLEYDFVGRDWKGLRSAVMMDNGVPARNEVLSYLDRVIASQAAGIPDDARNIALLKRIAGGRSYEYMYRKLFPALRSASLEVDYQLLNPAPQEPECDTVPELSHGIVVENPMPEPVAIDTTVFKACRPFYMSIKTNLLYDALALPSIGAEFYIGKNWSVIADWTYGWWKSDKVHRYWRAYGGDLGLRKWFGRKAHEKPLTGHHVGIFAGVVTYDFEFGGKGYMGGLPGKNLWHRCNYMAGVEYGYSLPLSRRLNMDFTIGIGYLGGKVIEYKPCGNCYRYLETRRLTWVGPTKLEVSLVWLIGCDNYNRKGAAPAL